MSFLAEETDLAQVAAELRRAFGDRPPVGYLPGKTMFRDFLMSEHELSALEAEQIIDTMVQRGFLRYEATTSSQLESLEPWDIETKPIPA